MPACLSVCLPVCVSVCLFICCARPHFWPDPDETLHGNLSDGQGVGCGTISTGPPGVGVTITKMPTNLPMDVCNDCEYFSRY